MVRQSSFHFIISIKLTLKHTIARRLWKIIRRGKNEKFPTLIHFNQAQIRLICVHYVCRLERQTIRLDTRMTRTRSCCRVRFWLSKFCPCALKLNKNFLQIHQKLLCKFFAPEFWLRLQGSPKFYKIHKLNLRFPLTRHETTVDVAKSSCEQFSSS